MSTSASNKNTSIFRLGDLPKNVADRVVALPRDITTDVTQRGRQVWLAGLGALATVEQEGTSLFQTLVQQGEKLVERGEKLEDRGVKQVEMVREDLTARQREALEQLEKAESTLNDSMMSTLKRLGVPSRAEVQELSANVDVLTRRVNALITKLDREPLVMAVPAPMFDPTVYTVAAREDGWVVEQEGSEGAVSVHATKDEAVERARSLANEHAPSQLVIRRKDGTIQDTFTYDA